MSPTSQAALGIAGISALVFGLTSAAVVVSAAAGYGSVLAGARWVAVVAAAAAVALVWAVATLHREHHPTAGRRGDQRR